MTIAELLERTIDKRDEQWLNEVYKKAVEVLRLFKKEWMHWETIGWALAIMCGFTEEDIENNPEIGWITKAALGYALSLSDKRKKRLVGNSLLKLTEIPPYPIIVEFGGENNYVPAVVAHYRISWNFPEIRQEFKKVIQQLRGD